MKRDLKKAFSFILVLALVIGLMPAPTSFALAPHLTVDSAQGLNSSGAALTLTDGAIWSDKTVSVVNKDEGLFEIKLKAIGQQFKDSSLKPKLDVVLVLDVSASMTMNKSKRLENLKKAATSAAAIFLASGTDNRMAIVKYSNTASVVSLGGTAGFSNIYGDVTSGIGNLSSDSYTNIQDGLLKAQNLIKNRGTNNARKPIIILMSDGEPNRYYTDYTTHSSIKNSAGVNNDTTLADNPSIWWTVKQGMYTKINGTPNDSTDDIDIYTIGFGVGTNARAIATLAPTADNTAGRRNGEAFDHTYWTQYFSADDNLTSIQDTFIGLANKLTNYAPTQKVSTASIYTDVFVKDVIGDGFELVPGTYSVNGGPMSETTPSGVTLAGKTLTWTIPGNSLKTRAAGITATTIAESEMNVLTFQVKISDAVITEGTYYTNSRTEGDNKTTFTTDAKNPFYKTANPPAQNLLNNGKLVLSSPPVKAKVTIKKTVTGKATGNNTFYFDLYKEKSPAGVLSDKINTAPIPVTVTGTSDATTTVAIDLPGVKFINGGTVKIYVQESQSKAGLTDTGDFWAFDANPLKEAVISKTAPNAIVEFENSYNPTGIITVKKDWNGATPSAIDHVTFTLNELSETEDGITPSQVGEPHTLSVNNNWTTTIGGLDISKKYGVSETPIPDYQPEYSFGSVTFGSAPFEAEIVITNRYIVPKGTITIQKDWIGDNEEDRPDALTFSYGRTEDQLTTIEMTSVGAVTREEGGQTITRWSTTINGLDFGGYTITEEDLLDYTATAKSQLVSISEDAPSRNAVVTFENTYREPTGSLTVEKLWTGDEGKETYRPASIWVKLFGWVTGESEPGGWVQDPVNHPDQQLSGDGNTWIATFDNLAFGKYKVEEAANADGDLNDYSVSYSALEVELSKGTKEDASSRTNSITIENSFKNPTGSIVVTKHWVESGVESASMRPGEITVILSNDEGYTTSAALSGTGDTWSYTFTDLPLEGTYTVTEMADDENDAQNLSKYTASISYGDDEDGIALDKDNRSGEVTITNTYARGTITVIKNWRDKGNPEPPATATFTLYQEKPYEIVTTTEVPRLDEAGNPVLDENDEPVLDIVVSTSPGITTQAIGTEVFDRSADPKVTSITFYDLEMGEDITYYVKESSVPFYTSKVAYYNDDSLKKNKESSLVLGEENQNGRIVITNVYDKPKGELTVIKNWDHGNNPNKPSEVTVDLYKNGKKVAKATFSGSYTFGDLDLNATYKVVERKVPKYQTTYSEEGYTYTPVKNLETGTVETGTVSITNTYIPEKGSLQVLKKWVDATGGAINVTLTRFYKDGQDQLVKDTTFGGITQELSDGNGWMTSFEGYDVYGPGGEKYVYKVSESADDVLWLYTAEPVKDIKLKPNKMSSVTITNNYTPYKGSLTINKVWAGEGEPSLTEIKYKLVVDGVTESAIRTLSKTETGWKDTLTDLDATKTYGIAEVDVPEEYKVSYDKEFVEFTPGNLTGIITITNSRTNDDPAIGIVKTVEKDTAILKDGSATFTYLLKIKNEGNRTLKDIYVEDQMIASGAAVGAGITYAPAPSSTEGGKVRFDLPENVLAPGESTEFSYTVTVNKKGEYDNTATAYGTYGGKEVSDQSEKSVLVKDLDLIIEKEVLSSKNITGNSGTFVYQLTVRNAGDIDFYDVEVQDVMKSSNAGATMTYSYSGTAEVTYVPEDHKFIIGDLAAGSEDVVITYTVAVSGTGTYDNEATVTGYYTTEPENPEQPGEPGVRTDKDDESVTVTASTPGPGPGPGDGGGGGGGGGGSTPNNPPVIIQNEPVPAGPVPAPEITIEDQAIPAGPLPKTGGLDALILYGLGALLAGGGFALRRKEKNK